MRTAARTPGSWTPSQAAQGGCSRTGSPSRASRSPSPSNTPPWTLPRKRGYPHRGYANAIRDSCLQAPREYLSHPLERELRRHGALAGMGSVADCFDNALTESAFAPLECELLDQQPGGRSATRREAKLAVFDYLETFYNPRRQHSALGTIAPATFEERLTTTAA